MLEENIPTGDYHQSQYFSKEIPKKIKIAKTTLKVFGIILITLAIFASLGYIIVGSIFLFTGKKEGMFGAGIAMIATAFFVLLILITVGILNLKTSKGIVERHRWAKTAGFILGVIQIPIGLLVLINLTGKEVDSWFITEEPQSRMPIGIKIGFGILIGFIVMIIISPIIVPAVFYSSSLQKSSESGSQLKEYNCKVGWKFNSGSPVTSSPTIVDGIVYFGNNNYLYAIDSNTGREEWKFELKHQSSLILQPSSPVVSNKIVYIGTWGGNIYALDSKTGKLKWKYITKVKKEDLAESFLAIDGGIIYFGSGSDFCALDSRTGKLIWQFKIKTGFDVRSVPIIENKMVYIETGDLYALDCKTGKKKWEFQISNNTGYTDYGLANANGTIYFSGGPYLYALDSKTGKQKWKLEKPDHITFMTADDSLVYFSSDIYLYAVDSGSGQEKWQFTSNDYLSSPNYLSSPPYVAEGTLYFGVDQYLYALDTKTGKERWKFEAGKLGDKIKAAPIIDNNIVYFGSSNNYLYTLKCAK